MGNINKTNTDNRIFLMKEAKPALAVFQLGLPVAAGMLVMAFYNLLDTYFIGLLKDDYQLAATNLSYPIMMLLMSIATIVGNGGSSFISRLIGAGEKEKAEHVLVNGIELTVVFGIILTLFGIIFINPIVDLLGAKENTFSYTKDYVLVTLIGSIFVMGNFSFGQMLRSEGSTLYSMCGMMAGTIANVVLDPLFIFVFNMGVKGAAIATVLGNVISVAFYFYYYFTNKTMLHLFARNLKIVKDYVREILRVGLPYMLEQFLSTIAMILMNNLAVAYGELVVAAVGISNKIMSFGNYIYQGMAAGVSPLVGYNYGDKNYSRLYKIIKSGICVVSSMEFVISILLVIIAKQLVGAFSSTAEVIEKGSLALRASLFALPFAGISSVCKNAFTAMGRPKEALYITAVRQMLLYAPALLILNKLFGFTGLIFAYPVKEIICVLFATLLLFGYIKKIILQVH